MTNKNAKNTTFVLKDQDGNFVSGHSIDYYSDTKRVIYSYCKTLTNGFYSQPTHKMAEVELDKLNQANARFKLDKTFHVEKIEDVKAVILEESKMGSISSLPFIHEVSDFDDNQKWIWVIKDSKGNLANKKSIKMWDSKTWIYVTYQTFSPECRGYMDLMACECAMDKLWSKSRDMDLDESFHLEYVNIEDAIKEHKAFIGDNMILVEKLVAA